MLKAIHSLAVRMVISLLLLNPVVLSLALASTQNIAEITAPSGNTYKTVGSIGKGGFGTVSEVIKVGTESKFAMKLIPMNRFRRGYNLVNDAKMGTEEGSYFVAIEEIFGVDYDKDGRIDDVIVISPLESVSINHLLSEYSLRDLHPEFFQDQVSKVNQLSEDLLKAIQEISKSGLMHGDIKPSNIFKRGNHHRLSDYDTTMRIGEIAKIYTPAYSPPEVNNELSFVANASRDIYAAGMTVYVMAIRKNDRTNWNETSSFDNPKVLHEINLWYEALNNSQKEATANIKQFLDASLKADPRERMEATITYKNSPDFNDAMNASRNLKMISDPCIHLAKAQKQSQERVSFFTTIYQNIERTIFRKQ